MPTNKSEQLEKKNSLEKNLEFVEDLQKWYKAIKDKTNVIKPMHKTFYGANEFAIMDINGFILTFSDILE